VIKILVVFTVTITVVALLTLAERKVSAWMQDRLGPNRVGPGGLLQPLADGLKNILKEETYPAQASRLFFVLAPMLALAPAMITFAVVPFAAPLPTPWGLVDMIVADLPIGVLYVLAITSLGVYGIVMAGWSSNNKYSFLGALRAGAQMVSYEVALGPEHDPGLHPGGQRNAHADRLDAAGGARLVAGVPAGPVVHDVRHLRVRRDEPPAVRRGGSRVGAGDAAITPSTRP
jgi:NADH-quinone oxidoreductase subunit H